MINAYKCTQWLQLINQPLDHLKVGTNLHMHISKAVPIKNAKFPLKGLPQYYQLPYILCGVPIRGTGRRAKQAILLRNPIASKLDNTRADQ